jgi:catechol 2,3-dioxygenase-like lactoylglutathione lyase family enzyme
VRLDHVALLVRDLDAALDRVRGHDATLVPGPIERFPREGTREVYVDRPGATAARLLLLEPIGPGPYARALERRGPGLHHVALDVVSARAWAQGLAGWVVHHELGRTLWLACKGAGALVEVNDVQEVGPVGPPLVRQVDVPGAPALGCDLVRASSDTRAWLDLGRGRVAVADLV